MNSKILIIITTFLWAGMVLAISFMEAPLKFQAPNITIELGLGIGKIVFSAMNKIEIIYSIIILISMLIGKIKPSLIFIVPIVILFVQSTWLLPTLTQRVNLILSGQDIAESNHHMAYIILEIIKVTSLLIAGLFFLKCNLNKKL